ncbi:MAG: hypothetical protein Q8K00_20515 [Syntrophales bacterium]|nr:hypothetical protein [Syntrophales bacterium]
MESIVIFFTVVFVGLFVVFIIRLILDRKRLKSFRGIAFNRQIVETLGHVTVDRYDGISMKLIVHRLAGEKGESGKIGLESHGMRFREHYFHMITLNKTEALNIADLLERIR